MNSETKTCQNCKSDFTIEPEDFQFYEKMKVSPPTWCPECRLQRRLVWRNERTLYKARCDLCSKETLAIYNPDYGYTKYCVECWWSDKWDSLEYGRGYDFSVPFFAQYTDLYKQVPRAALIHRNAVNAQFANYLDGVKNVYLSYSTIWGSEDVFFSKNIDGSHWIFDSFDVVASGKCYESVGVNRSFESLYAHFSRDCMNCLFVYDCVNCRNCFMCSNLRNKEYNIFNKQYTKDEYFRKLKDFDLGNFHKLEELKNDFDKLRFNSLHKYSHIVNCQNSSGNDLNHCKNVKTSFSSYKIEDSRFIFRSANLKDSMDTVNAGNAAELFYEFIGGGGDNSQYIRFCSYAIEGLDNVNYIDFCGSSSNLFGCVGLRNKQYCILNKQYTEEEYEKLVPKIIDHMNTMPYVDKKGRVYKYGEFFPPELSPFAYNETIAQEYFPLTKEQAISQGYRWRDPPQKSYEITVTADKLPNHIKDVDDSILKETIGCAHNQTCNEQCTQAFKIIPDELSFYRKMNLPLPRLCPNCRHYQRLKQRNPLKLWHRRCMCNTAKHSHGTGKCPNEFETPYASNRKEIVYCEQCYNAEVV